MKQTGIPYVFMRGGTSRGPYFNRASLPEDQETLAKVLIALIGSGHVYNIDGIGGGRPVTTKVAMLSKSEEPGIDIDYFFAQVSVTDCLVDFKPSCGNILSGVAPAAIELGLIEAEKGETEVAIRAVNTNARIIATVQTPDGVEYEGSRKLDGVPGTANPIKLQFMDTVGGLTGQFLPTGQTIDTFDGIDVTCMDVAMPMVIARAESFGLSGYETPVEIEANKAFFKAMESVRLQAGRAMGMGDVTSSVTPKFGLLSAPKKGGHVHCRYFMPWNCHPTMAVTGAQCLIDENPANIVLEHPAGSIEVHVVYQRNENEFKPTCAGLTVTARKLADGNVYIPGSVWSP